MAWDSVPWFVGGGAQHSPEVARLLAYAAFSGAEGILGALDLAVRELSTPGAKVRIAPGACSILNRASGGAYQAYAGRLPEEDTVDIAATGSGAGRSDLIVARIEDPFMAGEPWDDPDDATTGPYIFTRVISGVSSSATTVPSGTSGIALARIDIPASTATITQSMITDLRNVINPRRERDLISQALVTANETDLTSSSYVTFPSVASFSIQIPEWATQVKIVGTWAQLQNLSSSFFGSVRLSLGSLVTQDTIIDSAANSGSYRTNLINADRLAIPASMRGTTQTLKMQGLRSSGSDTVQMDGGSAIVIDYEFSEVASLT